MTPNTSNTGGNALSASPAQLAKSQLPRAVNEHLAERQGAYPVWVRSPKSGTEFYTGFSRAKLYEGAGKGHFRSVSIREPGAVKGTRLFLLSSILDFIAKCEAAAVKEEAE